MSLSHTCNSEGVANATFPLLLVRINAHCNKCDLPPIETWQKFDVFPFCLLGKSRVVSPAELTFASSSLNVAAASSEKPTMSMASRATSLRPSVDFLPAKSSTSFVTSRVQMPSVAGSRNTVSNLRELTLKSLLSDMGMAPPAPSTTSSNAEVTSLNLKYCWA